MSSSTRKGLADLHMHTDCSDGKYSVRELLDYVARQRPNLDVIAITDHDTLDASLWALEQQSAYSFEIVPGVEVSSRGGHVLALWVTRPIPAYLSLSETCQAIHEAGGLAVLAHPFHIEMREARTHARRYWRNPEVLVESGIDAIEVHNAGIVTPGSNLAARWMALRIGLPCIGGSDAHTLNAIGSGLTQFSGDSSAALRQALENGQTHAKGGSWPAHAYIEFLLHALQRREKTFSASINSSQVSAP